MKRSITYILLVIVCSLSVNVYGQNPEFRLTKSSLVVSGMGETAEENAALAAMLTSMIDSQLPSDFKDAVFDVSGNGLMDELYLLMDVSTLDPDLGTVMLNFMLQDDKKTYLMDGSGLWPAQSDYTQSYGNVNVLEGKDGKRLYFSGSVSDAFGGASATEGFIELLGTKKESVDVYFHDFRVNSVKPKDLGEIAISDVMNKIGSGLRGMASPFAIVSYSEKTDADAMTVRFHVRGENKLVGGQESKFSATNAFAKIFASIFYLVGSPIAIRSLIDIENGETMDAMSNKSAHLVFDDRWPSVSGSGEERVNGMLDLDIEGNHECPSIDLGNANGRVEFDGGRYKFGVTYTTDDQFFFVSSMSIAYRQFSMLGMSAYGVGTSMSPSTMNYGKASCVIRDGSFYTHSAEAYRSEQDVVLKTWYKDYTDLRLPYNSFVLGGTFNGCKPYRVDEATSAGVSVVCSDMKDDQYRSLCGIDIDVESYSKKSNGTQDESGDFGLKLSSTISDALVALGESGYTSLGYSYGSESLTGEDGKVTIYVPSDCEKPVTYKEHKWVSLIPLMGLSGLITMGGNVEVLHKESDGTTDRQNDYLFYAELNDYTKKNATVNLAGINVSVDQAINQGGHAEHSSVANPYALNDDLSINKDDGQSSYLLPNFDIAYGLYSMISFKSNTWYTICPPYDVHKMYVFETLESLSDEKAEEMGIDNKATIGTEDYLKNQGKADGVLAKGIITSLLPDIFSGKGSGVRMKLTDIAQNLLDLEPIPIVSYNPEVVGHEKAHSHFYLYEMIDEEVDKSGKGVKNTWSIPSEFKNFAYKWKIASPYEPSGKYYDQDGQEISESDSKIWLRKGHVYSIFLPSSTKTKYWDYKYIVFEGLGPQSGISGFEHSDFTTSDNIFDENDYGDNNYILALQGNSTMSNYESNEPLYRNVENDVLGLGRYDFKLYDPNSGNSEDKEKATIYPWGVYMTASETNVGGYETLSDFYGGFGNAPAAMVGQTTGENLPRVSDVGLKVWQRDGIMMYSFEDQEVSVYDIAGRCVWSGMVSAGDSQRVVVDKGVYLVSGMTGVVRILVE